MTLLPKVGAVADLRTHGTNRTNGYADTYEAVFSPCTATLSGEELAGVDAKIRAANDRIRQTVLDAAAARGTAGRVKFFDTYTLFEGFDFKNSLDRARQVNLGNGVTVDNRYLDSATTGRGAFRPVSRRWVGGGIQSVDGMHPSGCGYALFASEVMRLLGVVHNREALLRQGFAEDALLSNIPGELSVLVRMLATLRELERVSHFVGEKRACLTGELHLADALRCMWQVFLR